MQLYRSILANKTIYFMHPAHIGQYTGPLVAESNPSTGNTSHLDPIGAHTEVVEKLASLPWEASHAFSVPPELISHSAITEDADPTSVQWSLTEVPDDFIKKDMEDLIIGVIHAKEGINSPARKRPRLVIYGLWGLAAACIAILIAI